MLSRLATLHRSRGFQRREYVMITNQRSAALGKPDRSRFCRTTAGRGDRAVRVVQIALAIYLIPVLLVVLAIGGLGMVVLGNWAVFAGPIRGSRAETPLHPRHGSSRLGRL